MTTTHTHTPETFALETLLVLRAELSDPDADVSGGDLIEWLAQRLEVLEVLLVAEHTD